VGDRLAEEEKTAQDEMQWFIVHTLSGSERKAKKLLEEEIRSSALEEKFGQILIPTENVSRIRSGKRQVVERQLYPGYILIQMEMNEDTIRLVTSTPGVMSFLGAKLKPQSLREESVEVAEGPFVDFTGVVEELYPSRGKLKVMVTIFGRATPVELDFTQVKPI
jgi:transcriptional antiterminator NusG